MALELDPPGYVHPTVPPPASAAAGSGALRRWTGPGILIGLLSFVAIDLVGGPSFFPGLVPTAAAAAAAAAPSDARPSAGVRGVQLAPLLQAFPERLPSATCPSSMGQLPLVLYSSIDGRAEAPVSGAAPVKNGVLAASARQVAVLKTTALAEAGRYEGTLVVFDTATSVPLCGTVVEGAAVSHALARGAARLKIALDL